MAGLILARTDSSCVAFAMRFLTFQNVMFSWIESARAS